MWNDGLILFKNHFLIPQAARGSILKLLHAANQGIVRTKRRACQSAFWPGISNNISTLIEGCTACQERLASQQQEPMMSDPLPTRIFEDTSADLFQSGRLHVLVYAGRLSQLASDPSVDGLMDPTDREVIQAINCNFLDLGVTVRIRTDNGPKFSAGTFQQAVRKWGVICNSTPHYPSSTRHAEAAVQAVKDLFEKISTSGDLTSNEFLQLNPRKCGISPA